MQQQGSIFGGGTASQSGPVKITGFARLDAFGAYSLVAPHPER